MLWALPVCLFAIACSGSNGGEDNGGTDLGQDVGADAVQPDGLDDTGGLDPDVIDDTNVTPDPGVDVEPTDSIDDSTDALTLPDVDWTSLPTLPPGKTFTTRYAAGVGSAKINPESATPLSGFGFCMGDMTQCRVSDGIHDDLLATAVAFADTENGEVVIFVGVDSIGLFPMDAEVIEILSQTRIYEEYGVFLDGQRVIPAASHSHASPDTTALWGPMAGAGRDDAYMELMLNGVVQAAVDAYADLQDVEMDWGRGSSPNTDEDGFSHDNELVVLRGKKPNGDVLFTMTRWIAHPTAYGSSNLAISSDYIGPFRKKMEDEVGGMASFLNGPIGSVYPDRPHTCGIDEEAFPDGWRSPDVNPQDYIKVSCTGYQVADNAIAALQDTKPLAETGIKFRRQDFKFHCNNELFVLLRDFAPMPLPYFDTADPESKLDCMVDWVTLGDLNFLTTPGEAFPRFAFDGADLITGAGFENVIPLGLSPMWIGYLLTVDQWKDINLSYHQSLSPGPDIHPRFVEAVQAMVDAETSK
jgi:hypothetical protein